MAAAVVPCALVFRHPAAWWALAACNAITLGLYGSDKLAASRGGRRVPEAVLHLLAALGGSPAAFLGQRLFHHKTRKTSFQAVFWLIVAAQVAGAIVLTWRHPAGWP